jgi:hypothetical protein
MARWLVLHHGTVPILLTLPCERNLQDTVVYIVLLPRSDAYVQCFLRELTTRPPMARPLDVSSGSLSFLSSENPQGSRLHDPLMLLTCSI